MADHQPVPERRYQQRQRQQIQSDVDLDDGPVLLPRRVRVVLGGARAQRPRPSVEAAFANDPHRALAPGAIRSGGVGRGAECLSHARRGDSARH